MLDVSNIRIFVLKVFPVVGELVQNFFIAPSFPIGLVRTVVVQDVGGLAGDLEGVALVISLIVGPKLATQEDVRMLDGLAQIPRDEAFNDGFHSLICLLNSHKVGWPFGWNPLLDVLRPSNLPLNTVVDENYSFKMSKCQSM